MPIPRPLPFLVVAVLALMLVLAACGPPKMPSGPPPEYEDPPAPSWLEGGAPAAPDAADG